jgi:hypothetical protein
MHHLGNLMMLPPGVNSKLKDDDPMHPARTRVRSPLTACLLSEQFIIGAT